MAKVQWKLDPVWSDTSAADLRKAGLDPESRYEHGPDGKRIPEIVPDEFDDEIEQAAEPYPEPLSAGELFGQEWPEQEWTIAGLVMTGLPQTIDGDGGIGKSLASAQMAVHVAAGKAIFGRDVTESPVLYITAEDRYSIVAERMRATARALGLTDEQLKELPIQVWCLDDRDITLAKIDETGAATLLPFHAELAKRLEATPGLFVVLDSLNDVVEMNEVLRPPPNKFYKGILQPLCVKHDATILVLCHPSKASMSDGSWYSGGTGNKTALRNKLVMKLVDPANDEGPRTLGTLKRNYGRRGKPIKLVYDEKQQIFVWADGDPKVAADNVKKYHAVETAITSLLEKDVLVQQRNNGSGQGPKEIADALRKRDTETTWTWQEVQRYMKEIIRDKTKLGYRSAVRGSPEPAGFYLLDDTPAELIGEPEGGEDPNDFGL